jgi:hypothetical protein
MNLTVSYAARRLSDGYFYKIQTGNYVQARKMLLMK